MNRCLLLLLIIPFQLCSQPYTQAEINRWQQQAARVTIIRDNWGIPHIYGKSDADAVFGLLYAQCEDDFKRVEMNYIEKLGRTAEIKGESAIYDDLMVRILIDSADAVADYKKSPAWLKKLLDAFADGINYYLYAHPDVKPALLTRFQPWYPLLWTDGSIGAINTAGVSVRELRNYYRGTNAPSTSAIQDEEPVTGSNGFAISPAKTESGNAILYINPHVTFYFRPEVHVVSEEGLNAYGAVTWGQFFVYQGFNEHCGWMHTSSAVDVADLYEIKIKEDAPGKLAYEYNNKELPLKLKEIKIWYRPEPKNLNANVSTIVRFTQHGPIVTKRGDHELALKHNNRSMNGLIQSWQRTKAKSFVEFNKTMDLRANTSNNTVYADAEGNIAYWHGNYMPKRDVAYDWSKPVPGNIKATEYKGLHTVGEIVHSINPSNGWLQNCNSTPFTCAGDQSPKRENYPAYMAPDGELFRGINAVRVLSKENKFNIDKVIAAGYDTYLAAFEPLVPALAKAFDSLKKDDTLYILLANPVQLLKSWDIRCNENSVATTLAIEWGQRLAPAIGRSEGADQVEKTNSFVKKASAQEILLPLAGAIRDLESRFGRWSVPWGDINRFQRISGDIEQQYNDDKPSLPVSYVSSAWGMLPSYTSRSFPQTKKRYGVNGNSFICAVEFGKKIKARSLLAGGQSGDPSSKHFDDQGLMYTKGQFKEVLFYKEDVVKHAEKTYHPGEGK
jgi:acyl-homoserine-lactone acylase